MDGTITSVSLVHRILPSEGEFPSTAIDKRPVEGAVRVQKLGLIGDVVADQKHHGGLFQAVYAYADEDADWWVGELERDIPPGLFGENLRTTGIDVTGAEIGERWQIGEPGVGPVLEVTSPRTPCSVFAVRMDVPQWVKRFTRALRPGAYLSVVSPGAISAGDPIHVVHRPGHGVGVGDVTIIGEPEPSARLLAYAQEHGLTLHPTMRGEMERRAKRLAPS